uniref:Uncharacterized protein n=1 Tax=viral metagenome TaxID=1070528 RepID=A0A2V0R9N4_9ZZZZ
MQVDFHGTVSSQQKMDVTMRIYGDPDDLKNSLLTEYTIEIKADYFGASPAWVQFDSTDNLYDYNYLYYPDTRHYLYRSSAWMVLTTEDDLDVDMPTSLPDEEFTLFSSVDYESFHAKWLPLINQRLKDPITEYSYLTKPTPPAISNSGGSGDSAKSASASSNSVDPDAYTGSSRFSFADTAKGKVDPASLALTFNEFNELTITAPTFGSVVIGQFTTGNVLKSVTVPDWLNELQPFVDKAIQGFNSIFSTLAEVGNAGIDGVNKGLEFTRDALNKLAVTVTAAIQSSANTMIRGINNLGSSITAGVNDLYSKLKEFIIMIFKSISNFGEELVEKSVLLVNDKWSTLKTNIKDNWKPVFTLDFGKMMKAFISTLDEIGMYGLTSLGGVVVGPSIMTWLKSANLGTFTLYIPHFLDPLIATDAIFDDGEYHLSDLLKDILFIAGVVFLSNIVGKHAIKLIRILFGIGMSMRKALKEMRWKQAVLSTVESNAIRLGRIETAVGAHNIFN